MDHMRPISSIHICISEELKESFNWQNTKSLFKQNHHQKGTKYKFLDYRLQYIKAYHFVKLNEEGFNEDLHRWIIH